MTTPINLHASAFAYEGAGCLVLGEAGSGKSSLLAHALVLGGQLIADDRVCVWAQGEQLIASAPDTLFGIIELYGLGIISHPHLVSHPIHLVVSIDKAEVERLPEPQFAQYCGLTVPLLRLMSATAAQFSALLLYLKAVQEHRTLPTDWRPER